MALTAPTPERQDWTYRAARKRLIRAGKAQLPRHIAAAHMDRNANRVVECSCGWSGNGLGWAGHIDNVVRVALDATRV
jgi:hypothetical protein